jgi:hypothetical protein
VALTIDRVHGFKGGCPQRQALEVFVGSWSANVPTREDDLGRPAEGDDLPPVSKRWKIRYDAPLSAFVERARHLQSLREQRRTTSGPSTPSSDE